MPPATVADTLETGSSMPYLDQPNVVIEFKVIKEREIVINDNSVSFVDLESTLDPIFERIALAISTFQKEINMMSFVKVAFLHPLIQSGHVLGKLIIHFRGEKNMISAATDTKHFIERNPYSVAHCPEGLHAIFPY